MLSPLIERSRIKKALRDSQERGFSVLDAEACVEKAVEMFGDRLCVSCSFGSCSVVVLHMALQVEPHIRVVFNNTGVEYPETLAYRDLLVKDWGINLVETKPLMNFWDCVAKYGFPLIRGKRSKKYGNPGKPPCCKYLKEYPMRDVCRQFKIEATITGLRAAESRARMFAFSQLGQNYRSKKFFEIMKFNPIAFWPHEQVWSYMRQHGIPVNPIYEKVPRSGCQPCTGFLNWERQLSLTNPKMYRYVQKLRGVKLIDDFLALEEVSVESSCGSRLIPDQKTLLDWF